MLGRSASGGAVLSRTRTDAEYLSAEYEWAGSRLHSRPKGGEHRAAVRRLVIRHAPRYVHPLSRLYFQVYSGRKWFVLPGGVSHPLGQRRRRTAVLVDGCLARLEQDASVLALVEILDGRVLHTAPYYCSSFF